MASTSISTHQPKCRGKERRARPPKWWPTYWLACNLDSLAHCAIPFRRLKSTSTLPRACSANCQCRSNGRGQRWLGEKEILVLDDEAAERGAVRDALAALRRQGRLRRGRREAQLPVGVARGRGGCGGTVAVGGPEEPVPGLGGVGGAADDLAAEGAEAEVVEEAAGADLAEVGGGRRRRRGLAATRLLLLRPLVEEDDAGAVDDVGLHAGDVHEALDVRDADDVVVGGAPDLDGVVVAVPVLRQAQRAERARARARAPGGRAVQAEHVAFAAAVGVAVRPALREEARGQQRLQPPRPPLRVRRRGALLLRLRVRAAAALHGHHVLVLLS
jgi:hypothetical protein